ncbi:hypothetical protein GCM10017781_35400 [Deinococcus metalli]|uniref:Uncharacterized protein n=1 Tax=Deinococcus metalli TaxID=1141878 RepID=A0ABQ3JRE0_9DEIO|nr:hypothetical protein GCM10017781_35400 [Deinococcus metalli]
MPVREGADPAAQLMTVPFPVQIQTGGEPAQATLQSAHDPTVGGVIWQNPDGAPETAPTTPMKGG